MKGMKAMLNINNVGKFIPTFLFFICFLQASFAQERYEVPDFAFPETVEAKSEVLIDTSLSQGNDLMALRAGMNLLIAENVSNGFTNVGNEIILLDSLAEKFQSPFRQLTFLLEASILKEQYLGERSKYDERILPLDSPFPADTQEWSGEMFKQKIFNLVEQATKINSESKKDGIQTVSLLLSGWEKADSIGMTVEEFLYFKGSELLRSFGVARNATLIPFYSDKTEESLEGKCEAKALSLLNDIIDSLSGNNSLIKALAIKEKMDVVPETERESFLVNSINKLQGTEGEGLLLFERWKSAGKNDAKLYSQILKWLEQYPKGYGSEDLRFAMYQIQQRRIEVELPKVALPDSIIKGKVTYENLQKGYLLVYKLKSGEYDRYDNLILKKFRNDSKPLKIIEFEGEGNIPFSNEKEIEIPGLKEGLYVVVPSEQKFLPKGWNKTGENINLSTIRVTKISIITCYDSDEKDSGCVYVVNAKNQEPISGAIVKYYSGNDNKVRGTLTTDREGRVKMPKGYYRIEAIYGNNIAKTEAGFNYYPDNTKSIPHASILTDLGVYRPGDTIQFVVIGWLQEKYSNTLIKEEKIEVTLRDANFVEIGSIELTLDEDGRAIGKFIIPEGRLTGNYHLQAVYKNRNSLIAGSVGVRVEEYKLPGFKVTVNQDTTSSNDTIKFIGNASTFSGMPISYGNVEFKVEYLPWRWGFHGVNASYNESLKTDSNGNFSISLPLNNLKGTIFSNGRYSVSAAVTGDYGETQTSLPVYFYLGQNVEIRPQIPYKVRISGDTVNFNVPVYNMAGLPEQKKLKYTITNIYNKEEKIEGEFLSPSLSLDAQFLSSGKYRVSFSTINGEETSELETILYREEDKETPYPTPLWFPETEYYYTEGQQEINIKFGSYWNDWLLYYITDGSSIISYGWLPPAKGIQTMNIKIPASSHNLYLSLCGMHDFETGTGVISIKPKKDLEKMEIETVSFRDKISAGDEEDWTFIFKTEEKVLSGTNVIAVMTDKALNSIQDFQWNLNIFRSQEFNKLQLTPSRNVEGFTYRIFGKQTYRNYRNWFALPSWQTYGYPLLSYQGLTSGGTILYKAMATRNTMRAEIEDSVMEMAMEETAEDLQLSEEKEEELRPVEMPLAFFKPMLKANEKGEVSLKFKVPNYNTTWQLQLAGYTTRLMNSRIILQAQASKPVMVKTNLPQFLRTGDQAEISVVIYNNSEVAKELGGRIVILNPITGEEIAEKYFDPQSISPSGNRVVSLNFDVPDNISSIVVRSYGVTDNHSDGEQGWITILPSSTPVIEAITFYSGSQDNRIVIDVPKLKKDANVTLKYCDNPLWEVLLSLPSITENSNLSSISIARKLYGELVSLNLISGNEDIKEGLKKILESEDSTITMSNLEKNSSLKLTSLEGTPWINNASNETTRIRNLKRYLDYQQAISEIDKTIENLSGLQKENGGWSWCEGMKSSPYITSEIICLLGYMSRAGVMTPALVKMAEKAVKYYDAYLLDLKKEKKEFKIHDFLSYFYHRDMLRIPMNKGIKEIKSNMIDTVVMQWKHYPPALKAKAFIVLDSEDKYTKERMEILESLQQIADRKLTLEDMALMLEAMGNETSVKGGFEKIREILFLRKETSDYGSTVNTVEIVSSLLKTISPENFDRKMPEIYVSGQNLNFPIEEALIGSYTLNLPVSLISGKKIDIRRENGIPAWGGIISQYIKPIKDIKKTKVENLSIEKRIFKKDEDGRLKEVTTFNKGDEIIVAINITCGKTMDYVEISDSRAACLQPEATLSEMIFADGLPMYREILKDRTIYFIERLPEGKYVIEYKCHADRSGEYSLGIAEAQCLNSPSQVAHTAGSSIKVNP